MIKLTVNGTVVQFDGDLQMRLLWYLRDELKLTGTKYGCGKGLCGACTVHMGESPQAIRSCQMPMAALEGATIATIESLSQIERKEPEQKEQEQKIKKATLHPVQSAWIQYNVPQCGYCQPGQIMTAAALLAQNPNPNRQEILNAMEGNLCRCGTYPRIIEAISSLCSTTSHDTDKSPVTNQGANPP